MLKITRTLGFTLALGTLAITAAGAQTPPARPDFATTPGWAYIVSAKCWAHFPDSIKGLEPLFMGWNGKCTNQRISGAGTLSGPPDLSITGTFENGELKGTGKVRLLTETLLYDGTFSDGALHGTGKQTFADGSHYQGGFVDTKFDGQGHWDISPTVSFEGTFKNGDMAGHGILTYPQGSMEGEFKGWAMDGNVTFRPTGGGDPITGLLGAPQNEAAAPVVPPPFPPTLRQELVASAHFIVMPDGTLTDIHAYTSLPGATGPQQSLRLDLEKAVQTAKYTAARVGGVSVPMPWEFRIAYSFSQ